ncbi:hypothetical protein ABZT06_39840 [Streptomyces sp. NPDC005483]|uniref:hypothetical protein n=1 Tax=Streptomyces sp. NPDC005483 TaxID=3154882 RepID=UPI0033B88AC3
MGRRPRGRTAGASLALSCVLAVSAGCASPSEMSFRQDKRMTIVSPHNEETVRLPFTVDWTMRDFTAVEPGSPVRSGAGYYAILLDRYPVAPGKSLASLVTNDACVGVENCPDAAFLAENLNVYVTSRTSYTINAVPTSGVAHSSSHFLTVILVDGAGQRMGESSWTVSFTVAGDAS